jgi:hypothetical protein
MWLVGEGRLGAFEIHTGQPVEPYLLDDRLHRGLRIVQSQDAAVDPEPAGQGGEVEHQRRITEHQLGQIDDDVTP